MDMNQKILELFVEKEVLADLTDIVEYVFDTATNKNCPPFDPDSVKQEGSGYCPACGANAEFIDFHTVVEGDVVPLLDYTAEPDERYQCPYCGIGYPTKEEAKACCADIEIATCQSCGHTMLAEEYMEISSADIGVVEQWLLVTPWLAKQLEDFGEIIIPEQHIWGRQSSNVPVASEDSILQICNSIGIMAGQSNDWSKYLHVS